MKFKIFLETKMLGKSQPSNGLNRINRINPMTFRRYLKLFNSLTSALIRQMSLQNPDIILYREDIHPDELTILQDANPAFHEVFLKKKENFLCSLLKFGADSCEINLRTVCVANYNYWIACDMARKIVKLHEEEPTGEQMFFYARYAEDSYIMDFMHIDDEDADGKKRDAEEEKLEAQNLNFTDSDRRRALICVIANERFKLPRRLTREQVFQLKTLADDVFLNEAQTRGNESVLLRPDSPMKKTFWNVVKDRRKQFYSIANLHKFAESLYEFYVKSLEIKPSVAGGGSP